MEKVGLAITVPNAHQLTKKVADHITTNSGGTGALTEVVEWILTQQEKYDDTLNKMKKEVYHK